MGLGFLGGLGLAGRGGNAGNVHLGFGLGLGRLFLGVGLLGGGSFGFGFGGFGLGWLVGGLRLLAQNVRRGGRGEFAGGNDFALIGGRRLLDRFGLGRLSWPARLCWVAAR